MTAWLAEFRFVRPPAKIAEIAKKPPNPNLGNNGNFGSGIPESYASAYEADARRRAENAFSPEALADPAELMVRGELLP
jgi:hypothetical protein